MSDLFKSFNILYDANEKQIIDNNLQIAQKIRDMNSGIKSTDGFSPGLGNLSSVREYDDTDDDDYEEPDVSYVSPEEDGYDGRDMSEDILETARSDAEAIIEKAANEAAAIMEQARKRGYEDGLAQGRKLADQELEVGRTELESRKKKLEQDYLKAKAEMEPELVNSILDVVFEVTHVLAEDRKDMVLQLINGVMSDTVISNNFLIRVSRDDADYLRENKDKITGSTDRDINIEIVADALMKKNECMIETDFGVFDCSLDMQLENLISDIRLLACATGSD